MERLLLLGVGIITGVVGGFFAQRGIKHFCGDAAPSWPDLQAMQFARARSKKRPQQQLGGKVIDNGAIGAPESV
jgi:hypothetical protein